MVKRIDGKIIIEKLVKYIEKESKEKISEKNFKELDPLKNLYDKLEIKRYLTLNYDLEIERMLALNSQIITTPHIENFARNLLTIHMILRKANISGL
ncbi:MAG: hypothetical protein R3E95_16165 [Thiolinea sp.]